MELGLCAISEIFIRVSKERDAQIDEIVEEEGRTGSEEAPAISLESQQVRDMKLFLEVVLAEQDAITHPEAEECHAERQEDRNAVHGVKSNDQVVVGSNERQKVNQGANRSSRRGHQCRHQDLDRASDRIEMLVEISLCIFLYFSSLHLPHWSLQEQQQQKAGTHRPLRHQ